MKNNETVYLTLVGAPVLAAAVMLFLLLISPLVGYVAGWAFEMVFPSSWGLVHDWLGMPHGMTGGTLGAFLGCFGGLVGRTGRVVSKSGK